MNEVVKLERHDVIGIVTVNSPPVNALSAAVRGGILECIKGAIADPEIKAIVLTCAGRTFIAGADITGHHQSRKGLPTMFSLTNHVTSSPSVMRSVAIAMLFSPETRGRVLVSDIQLV